jgi:hypothetical protein
MATVSRVFSAAETPDRRSHQVHGLEGGGDVRRSLLCSRRRGEIDRGLAVREHLRCRLDQEISAEANARVETKPSLKQCCKRKESPTTAASQPAFSHSRRCRGGS